MGTANGKCIMAVRKERNMRGKEMKYSLMLLCAGICWGTSGIFVKALGAYGLSTGLISCCRVIPAFLILFVTALLRCRKDLFRISRKNLLFCALMGLICQCFFNLSYTAAIRTAGMSFAAVLLYLAPVMTAFFSSLFLRERITNRKRFALAVNVLGCALTVTGGQLLNVKLSLSGFLFGVGAAFFYSLAPIIGSKASSGGSPLVSTVWTFFFASVFMLAAIRPFREAASMPAGSLPFVLGYAFIPTALAYIFYFNGLQGMKETSRVPVQTSTEPVAACLIGFAAYGEELHLVNALGIALVILSQALANLLADKEAAPFKEVVLHLHQSAEI